MVLSLSTSQLGELHKHILVPGTVTGVDDPQDVRYYLVLASRDRLKFLSQTVCDAAVSLAYRDCLNPVIPNS